MTQLNADGNANGIVDAADYVLWRRNINFTTATSSALGASPIPEPATIVVLAIAVLLNAVLTRKEKI
jgi:hypothetical protein